MTTTEAIKQLQTEHDLIAHERDLDGSQFAPALLEALAMAIEVLKCSEIPNCSEPKCADGCIYGWGSSECGHCDYRSEDVLKSLPPAQPKPDKNPLPEQPDSDRLGVKTVETCTDTISRQAAIDMLKNRWKKTRNYEGIGDDIAEECELYLKQVPSAQPEREKGEWIDGFMCSVCRKGYRSQPTIRGVPMFKYCPECGADMRGKQDAIN